MSQIEKKLEKRGYKVTYTPKGVICTRGGHIVSGTSCTAVYNSITKKDW